MELWIRNQDKKVLVKINNICVNENGVIFTDSYPDMWLGAYKSEKRAIEVLDEIQNILKPKTKMITHSIAQENFLNYSPDVMIQPTLNELQIQQADTWVYQMPEK